jgi:hypothetical protein
MRELFGLLRLIVKRPKRGRFALQIAGAAKSTFRFDAVAALKSITTMTR